MIKNKNNDIYERKLVTKRTGKVEHHRGYRGKGHIVDVMLRHLRTLTHAHKIQFDC